MNGRNTASAFHRNELPIHLSNSADFLPLKFIRTPRAVIFTRSEMAFASCAREHPEGMLPMVEYENSWGGAYYLSYRVLIKVNICVVDISKNGTEPMNCRILVVDDDRTVRSAIAEFLNDEGFQTDTAENAKAAVTRMKTVKYDIVVMEVSLPRYSGGYSGRYLLNHIQNRYPTIKTIVITGDVTIETGLESIRLGANCWMTKPFSLVTLRKRISTIIQSNNVLFLPKRRRRNHQTC